MRGFVVGEGLYGSSLSVMRQDVPLYSVIQFFFYTVIPHLLYSALQCMNVQLCVKCCQKVYTAVQCNIVYCTGAMQCNVQGAMFIKREDM